MNPKLLYVVAEVHSILKDTALLSKEKQANLSRALKAGQTKPFVIVASELVSMLESKWGVKLMVKKTFHGSALENCRLNLDMETSICTYKILCTLLSCYVSHYYRMTLLVITTKVDCRYTCQVLHF